MRWPRTFAILVISCIQPGRGTGRGQGNRENISFQEYLQGLVVIYGSTFPSDRMAVLWAIRMPCTAATDNHPGVSSKISTGYEIRYLPSQIRDIDKYDIQYIVSRVIAEYRMRYRDIRPQTPPKRLESIINLVFTHESPQILSCTLRYTVRYVVSRDTSRDSRYDISM